MSKIIFPLLILINFYGQAQVEKNENNILVSGKIIDPDSTIKKIKLAINRLGFDQEVIYSNVDTAGNFHFQFYSSIPTDIWLVYQANCLFLVHPNDSIFIQFNGGKKGRVAFLESMSFTGDRRKTNNNIKAFQAEYFTSSFYNSWDLKAKAKENKNPEQFRFFADSLRAEGNKIFSHFLSSQSSNQESIKWIQLYLDNNYYHDLTSYPPSHKSTLKQKNIDWDVALSYYSYFKTNQPITESLVSADFINSFTNKYLYRYIRLLVAEKDFEKQAKDSVFFHTIVEETTDQLLKEVAITQYCDGLLSEANLPAFENNIKIIKQNLTSGFLYKPLFEKYEKVKIELEEAEMTSNIKLNTVENISGFKFLIDLLKKHKGRAIYVDVWATWCGPCLEEFPFSIELHEDFKDVDFVYLCIDSQEASYKNTIKRYGLEGNHYFLNKDQSTRLREELNMNGVPHYLLIDKSGEIIYSGYQLKPSNHQTKEKILKLVSQD
ncbi:MAG: TlpA family protein disulfide reductase [Candidatus Cyclobacteriaceae bacterium M2_1C_046]